MWCWRWATIVRSLSTSVIILMNCGTSGEIGTISLPVHRDNNFKQHSSDSACNWLHICIKGAGKELGGRWMVFFLNRTGKAKPSLAASLHQLVASSPRHMPPLSAYTHWTNVVPWLIKTLDIEGVTNNTPRDNVLFLDMCMHMKPLGDKGKQAITSVKWGLYQVSHLWIASRVSVMLRCAAEKPFSSAMNLGKHPVVNK